MKTYRSTINHFLIVFVCLVGLFVLILFIYLFLAVSGLRFCARAFSSCATASGGHSSSQCAGLSLSRPLLLWSTGSRHAGSVIVAHGSSCSAACGIFPNQGLNPCPLHWEADSRPLHHHGSPTINFCIMVLYLEILLNSLFNYR